MITTGVLVANMLLFHGDNGNNALACSCSELKPPRESLAQSSAVFMGNVTDVIPAGQYGGDQKVTFDASKAWKGISKSIVILSTADNSASCGYHFEEGVEYVVYAHGSSEESLGVSLCSRTIPIDGAYEDLAALGTGYLPEHVSGGTTVSADPYFYEFPAILGIGAAIAGIIAFLTLRKRK